MSVDLNKLLALPQNERRRIAEKLWGSLDPVNNLTKEDKNIISLLDKRWESIKSGKSKTFTSSALKKMINSYRDKK